MTQNTTLADIATEIEALGADLLKVNATIDLIGKPAIDAATKIEKALDDAKDRFTTALANQATEERNKRLGRFSDIRVTVKPGENLISTGFVIRYIQDAWDVALGQTVPKQHECNGFAALADDAYEYLVAEKPENIPAVIMALAPGRPYEAMSIYLQAKARGYFKGLAVAS
ncbi:hypothetical protein [Sphingomonas sp. R86521]|uniref:hypothetical protein n=1 Tax=Sphingomonas sp. R86521 TaxID=3093860 RepID=UPI0036D409AB